MAKKKTKKKVKALNDREVIFVAEYVISLNAYDAAVKADFAESTAKCKAGGWVRKGKNKSTRPHIRAAIDKIQAKLAVRHEVTADKVIQGFAALAFAPRLTPKDENFLRDAVKDNERIKALENLARHLNLFKDDNNHGLDDIVDDFIARTTGTAKGVAVARSRS